MKYLKMMSFLLLTVVMFSCSDDETKPPTADFFFEIDGTEVTFTSQMSNVSSFEWNFGDGSKSTERNPVHAYERPSDVAYKVSLNIIGDDGSLSAVVKDVKIDETFEYLLTGGAARPEGKIWRLKYEIDPNNITDGAGILENNLTIIQPVDEDGLLEWIGLEDAYDDEFTFVYDGSYKVDNADGNSLAALLYATLEGMDIKTISLQPEMVPLADVVYSPKTDATWSINTDDFSVDAWNPISNKAETVTFSGWDHLVLDEYFGFKDYTTTVIIKSISETEMNVAIAINTEISVSSKPTYLFHITFKAVPFIDPAQ